MLYVVNKQMGNIAWILRDMSQNDTLLYYGKQNYSFCRLSSLVKRIGYLKQ